MVQCERCNRWQHTPCAGFCSNKDRRIEESDYHCFLCRYGKLKPKAANFLREYARQRRAIGILYSEGIKSITNLSQRLSCAPKTANDLLDGLEKEGIVKINKLSRKNEVIKIATKEIKDYIIKKYFTILPENIPEFIKLQGLSVKKLAPPSKTKSPSIKLGTKRRKSVAQIPVRDE